MNTRFTPEATLLADFYKISHREQYPVGTERVYSTWIPRATRIPGVKNVVAFGFQAFIQRYLIDYFNENFFYQDCSEVVDEYKDTIAATLGIEPTGKHIADLHDLGYLPLLIKALPEGSLTPIRVPMLTIENTDDRFFWLTNYIETLFSCECWMPSTSATLAYEYRKLLDEFAMLTVGENSFVQFQGHDFSMRGMSSLEAASASGAGHLLSFVGTDTIPAILFHQQYYNADPNTELVGTSIPATEHSVMCAYGRDEFLSYKRIITDIYPKGFVSIVSDTWDLWQVLNEVIRPLKQEIMDRDGKVVIRPDSGDPVLIICGDESARPDSPQFKGVIEILWDIFGGRMTPEGYKQLDDHIGCIYGDAITLSRCREICERLERKGFASTNMVYGVGSYTYQYQTRDTFGFALKSTWAKINGEEINIFKDPVTDGGMKKSLTGRVVVLPKAGTIDVKDGLSLEQERGYDGINLLQTVFYNGQAQNIQSLSEIRSRLLDA